jgi:arabinan endo-1,5-alpha-L-arabinosidase
VNPAVISTAPTQALGTMATRRKGSSWIGCLYASAMMTTTRITAATLLVAAGLCGVGTATPAATATVVTVAPQPVITRDFPDPSAIQADGGWYAYSTNSSYGGHVVNVPVATAPAATGPWTAGGTDALPNLPDWVAYDSGSGSYDVWAPDVSRRDDGTYLLYYTARDTSGLQCLGAATAATPAGPFTPVGTQPLVCNAPDHGDIDPTTFSEGGHHYLVYKDNANSAGQPSSIWLNEVAANGITWIGNRSRLLTADSGGDERTVAEAPSLTVHNGQYVLLYSADDWNATYHEKYAVSATLTGSYTKQGTMVDTSTWSGAVADPGGADVVGGWLFYHANTSGGRGLYVSRLTWPHATPQPAGIPPVPEGTYEFTAEHSGQSLDVYDGSTASGAAVIQWPYHDAANEHWTVRAQPDGTYEITADHSGLALSVRGATAPSAAVDQEPFTGAASQLWYLDRDFDGYLRIASAATGALLDVYDASTANGTAVIVWPDHDGTNERWLPTPL